MQSMSVPSASVAGRARSVRAETPVTSASMATPAASLSALTGAEVASTSPSPRTSKTTAGAPAEAALTPTVALKLLNWPPRPKVTDEGALTPRPLS